MEEVLFDQEKVMCRRVNLATEYEEAFKTAGHYIKIAPVTVRQATERELISTHQDGTENYAEPGDFIILDSGDHDPYVYGNKRESLESRQQHFQKEYELVDSSSQTFQSKEIIKAVQVHENIVFTTSWGEMAVKAGGWITDQGYGIAKDSFQHTYRQIESEHNLTKAT